jgi:hypothetical protein
MFSKALLAAVLALPLTSALPAQEAKADIAPQTVAQSVNTAVRTTYGNVRTVRHYRTMRVVHRNYRVRHCGRHGYRVHFHRR